jgi:hypothetical protein
MATPVPYAKNQSQDIYSVPPGDRRPDGNREQRNGTIPSIVRELPARQLNPIAAVNRIRLEQCSFGNDKNQPVLRE